VQARDFLGGVFAPFRMKTWTSASRPGAPSVPDSTWDNRIFNDESWKVRRARACGLTLPKCEEIKLTFWLTNSCGKQGSNLVPICIASYYNWFNFIDKATEAFTLIQKANECMIQPPPFMNKRRHPVQR